MSEQNKGTKIGFEDQTYRLAEMADAIRQSIANAKHVASEQQLLIDIVEKSNAAKKFANFIKGCKEQIDNINRQVEALSIQAALLDQVVNSCTINIENAKLVSMLLKALRVFDGQATAN